jgi:site-specific DNA recombinase
MTRCALYLRLSHDRPDETSTEHQETDCRKLAEAKGWEVVAVYKDLQSAWSDKERPDFERMLRDAGSGAFDVVLVWKFDRMARSVLTFERAVRGLTGCGVQFASLSESVDTTTPMGTFTLHLAGALAQLESDTISYRVRAANRHLASKGRAASGGRRCFGYNRDGTVEAEEAGLLREAARRFLDGATLTAVVKGWNAQGIRTPSGNDWGPSVLGRLLRAERIAGMRRHGEQVFAGDWEPIIDQSTFYALAEALEDSKHRTVRRGIKRHLLTGIARRHVRTTDGHPGSQSGPGRPLGLRERPRDARAAAGSPSSPARWRTSWSKSCCALRCFLGAPPTRRLSRRPR